MPSMPPTFRPAGARSTAERKREHDDRRRCSQPWRVWYSRRAWAEARALQLARRPLCETCLAEGRITAATVVHHAEPHRGDWRLFIDPANHRSACKACHDGPLQSAERQAGGGSKV
jgi:5-methylcytosine-specific restriction protein A